MIISKNISMVQRILPICEEIANGYDSIGSCIYGSSVYGDSDGNSPYDCLLILKDFEKGIRYNYRKSRENSYIAFLMVDQELFEMDVKNGKIGDFLANRILTPYVPVLGSNYLFDMELLLKKRVVMEETENLIIEYGELSRSFAIKPRYFALARMAKRAKSYPPLGYSYYRMLYGGYRNENMTTIMDGFSKAVDELKEDGYLKIEGDNVSPSDDYVDKISSKRTLKRVVNIFEQSKASLYSYLMQGRAGFVDLDTISKELTYKTRKDLLRAIKKYEIEDPRNYLYLKVSGELVCLNDRSSIKEIVRKIRPEASMKISPLAGALNEVYLVMADDEKMVAKKFTDWHSFKWFALNVVALGTKTFCLSGKARLENELGISVYLLENGIYVPSIIFASIQRRILIRKYIEGFLVSEIVKRGFNENELSDSDEQCFYRLGKNFAKIHSLDVELGDTKPENFVISHDGEIFALDLEQSRRNGDATWDIAEFLYYSGHYSIRPKNSLKQLVENFVDGYLEIGNPSYLRKAANLSYVKVFSMWTSPQVMREITEILRGSSSRGSAI